MREETCTDHCFVEGPWTAIVTTRNGRVNREINLQGYGSRNTIFTEENALEHIKVLQAALDFLNARQEAPWPQKGFEDEPSQEEGSGST